jgi:hypothetical protein
VSRDTDDETSYGLSHPGRLLDVLERAIAAREGPRRSGWSTAAHLARDLERHFGVTAPPSAVAAALRTLSRRGRLRLRMDADGGVWYRAEDPG